jgi:hypothetical protein
MEWAQVILEDDIDKGISNTKGHSTYSGLLPLMESPECTSGKAVPDPADVSAHNLVTLHAFENSQSNSEGILASLTIASYCSHFKDVSLRL